jgi:uncharacterized membrane protein YfcA
MGATVSPPRTATPPEVARRSSENPNSSLAVESISFLKARTPPAVPDPETYRRLSNSTFWITVAVIYGLWLVYMLWTWQFSLFVEKWFMAVVMVLGSFVAGSTSAGGGAIAFPAMTLFFRISPESARDFCLAIQSVGMSAAAFTIWRCRIPVERNAIVFSTLGGAIGVICGTFFLVPYFTDPSYVKMFFASLWLSFVVALYMINRDRKREIYYEIVGFETHRAGTLLFAVGMLGGVVTSLTGSGLDILTFSVLCLRYRICEKVATPTSVVLMAGNSIVGFCTHLFLIASPDGGHTFWQGNFHLEAWEYWLVSIPAVVIGAPAGARYIRNKSRSFVASLLYASILIQFLAAVLIIGPRGSLLTFTIVIFLSGASLFLLLAGSGRRRIDKRLHQVRKELNEESQGSITQ